MIIIEIWGHASLTATASPICRGWNIMPSCNMIVSSPSLSLHWTNSGMSSSAQSIETNNPQLVSQWTICNDNVSDRQRDRQRLDLINSPPTPTSRSGLVLQSVLQSVELRTDWGPAEYLTWQPARLVILQLGQTLQCIYTPQPHSPHSAGMVALDQTLKQFPAQIRINNKNDKISLFNVFAPWDFS